MCLDDQIENYQIAFQYLKDPLNLWSMTCLNWEHLCMKQIHG